jgi:hypothetical protein
LQGFDEVIKKYWEIIDSSKKTDEKEKMKAINLIYPLFGFSNINLMV